MKKLLSLLGSVAMVGTAGATVVACGNEKPSEAIPEVSKQELVDSIHEASKLIANNKNPNPQAEAKLKVKIADAQKVVDEIDATQDVVDTAKDTLNQAIKEFKEEVKTDNAQLIAKIDEAIKAKNNPKNINKDAEEILEKAISNAQELANNPNASQADVENAIKKLEEAINEFRTRTATDYSKLEEAISNAVNLKNQTENPNADKEALQLAIEEAKEVFNDAEAVQETVNNATQSLNAAIDNFKKQMETETDYSELEAAIKNAEAAINNNKNPNWEAEKELKAVIGSVRAILNNENASQTEVENAKNLLNKNIEKFQKATETHKETLEETIKKANAAKKANKNPNEDADIKLNVAIGNAKVTFDNGEATQIAVDEAVVLLEDAIVDFQQSTQTRYTELNSTIDNAQKALNRYKNPNADKQALMDAIKRAQSVANNENATQKEVDDMKNELENATIYFIHTPATSFEKLDELIKEAESARDSSDNPNADKNALNDVIKAAKSVNENKNASQKEVDEAKIALENALKFFNDTAYTNFKELETTLNEANDALEKHKNNPNAEIDRFTKAIAAAQKVLDEADAIQDVVDKVVTNLRKEIKYFVGTPLTDYSDIENAISEAENLIKDSTAENKEILEKAVKVAKQVKENKNAVQESIDNAEHDLRLAINAFKEGAKHITTLEKAISSPKKLWFDSELFNLFSQNKLGQSELSKLVWTGMFDARHQGGDSESAKKAREESEKEFKDKNLASIINFQARASDIQLQDAKKFAEEVLNTGREYLDKMKEETELTTDNLSECVTNLNNYLEGNMNSSQMLLQLSSKTVSAISELKSNNPDINFGEIANKSFNLVIKQNENVKLKLEKYLIAHSTYGKEIEKTLIQEGSATFQNLTFVLTI